MAVPLTQVQCFGTPTMIVVRSQNEPDDPKALNYIARHTWCPPRRVYPQDNYNYGRDLDALFVRGGVASVPSPNPHTLITIQDRVYGRDQVPAIPPPWRGMLIIRPQRHALKSTVHYRIQPIPLDTPMWYWDRNSVSNFLAALRYRVGRDAGRFAPSKESMDAVFAVRSIVIRQLEPLVRPPHVCRDTALAWLSRRTYPTNRMAQLRRIILDSPLYNADGSLNRSFLSRHCGISLFIKNEGYSEPTKPPRLICNRTDYAKCVFGPFFEPLNDVFFHQWWSVKHEPFASRPSIFSERFGEAPVLVCDYSSFETSMRPPLQRLIECHVYRALLTDATDPETADFLLSLLLRPVRLRTRCRSVEWRGDPIRFSGDMNTSLGNTLNNLVLLWSGLALQDPTYLMPDHAPPLVVEGDDSITQFPQHNTEQFLSHLQSFGLSVKAEWHSRVCDAGFCGTRWNSAFHTVPDYHRVLAKMCDTSVRQPPELTWAFKCLSAYAQFPHAPIIKALAAHYCRGSIVAMNLNQWEVGQLIQDGIPVVQSRNNYLVPIPIVGFYPPPTRADYLSAAHYYHVSPAELEQLDRDIVSDGVEAMMRAGLDF